MSQLGAGVLRLWAEKQIAEGRMINASALAREASGPGAVQPSTPWSLVLGRTNYSDQELARVLAHFSVSQEEAEIIGGDDGREHLADVVKSWTGG